MALAPLPHRRQLHLSALPAHLSAVCCLPLAVCCRRAAGGDAIVSVLFRSAPQCGGEWANGEDGRSQNSAAPLLD